MQALMAFAAAFAAFANDCTHHQTQFSIQMKRSTLAKHVEATAVIEAMSNSIAVAKVKHPMLTAVAADCIALMHAAEILCT